MIFPVKRTLRTPPFVASEKQPPAEAPALPVEELHPCVLPRRRFIRRFLICCAALTAVGLAVAAIRFARSASEIWWAVLYVPYMLAMASPAYLSAIPARTKRGTLLQLVGLVLPLSSAVAACTLCWSSATDSTTSLAYAMSVCLPGILGTLFLFLPGWLLHLGLSALEKRRNR